MTATHLFWTFSFPSLLWTSPCRRCILFFNDYLCSSSYNSHNLPRIVDAGWKKKKANSQWTLAAVCASVSHCSSISASETLIATMAPVWVTFWRVGSLLDYLSVSPSQAGNNSRFSSPSVSLLRPPGGQNRQSTVEGSITAGRAAAPVKPRVCAPLKPNTTPTAQHAGYRMTPAWGQDNSSHVPQVQPQSGHIAQVPLRSGSFESFPQRSTQPIKNIRFDFVSIDQLYFYSVLLIQHTTSSCLSL